MDRLLKILIVDDESSQRTGLAGMVKAWGMQAETATDGADALEKLETFAADVIVTDLNMPRMDGYELMRTLREDGNSVPVIVVTAFGNVETAVRTVHEMGAYWFLEKPMQANVMQALLRRAARTTAWERKRRRWSGNCSTKAAWAKWWATRRACRRFSRFCSRRGPARPAF